MIMAQHIMAQHQFCVIVIVTLMLTPEVTCKMTSPEAESIRQLYNVSLHNYNTNMRPVLNQSHAVKVKIEFHPLTILTMDTTAQKFEMIGKFTITWVDEFLPWDPSSYFGTNTLQVLGNQIWRPSLEYSQTFTKDTKIGDNNDLLMIQSDGTVTWRPLQVFSTTCTVSVKYYPFDKQTCDIYLYDADLNNAKVTYNSTTSPAVDNNPEWELLTMVAEKKVRYGTDLIKFTFKLQRRNSLTMYALAAPLLIMAALNVFIFLLPVTSGEKSSVAITLFLSYGVLMVVTRDMMPENSLEISLLVQYVFVLLVLSAFTVVYSIVESRVQASYGNRLVRVPKILRTTVNVTEIKEKPNDTEKLGGDARDISRDSGDLSRDCTRDKFVTITAILQWLDTLTFCLVLICCTVYSVVVFNDISSH